MDEQYSDIPAEVLAARRRGERPLQWLLENRPESVRAAFVRIYENQAPALRQAVVDVLQQLETTQGARVAQSLGGILDLVEGKYSTLPEEVWLAKCETRREMQAAVLQEFPQIVASTLEEKHPGLAGRVQKVVDRHYPDLRHDVWTALEGELPGIQAEVSGYIGQHYPNLFSEVESALKS